MFLVFSLIFSDEMDLHKWLCSSRSPRLFCSEAGGEACSHGDGSGGPSWDEEPGDEAGATLPQSSSWTAVLAPRCSSFGPGRDQGLIC